MGICSFISSSCISELCVHNTLQILINSVWGASILSLPSVSSELFYCIPNCIFHRSQSLNWLSILNCYLLLLFSCLVAPDSLWSHGLQQASLPCRLPSPRACSNSYPLSQWCHLMLLSSRPFLLMPSIFHSIQGLFQWVGYFLKKLISKIFQSFGQGALLGAVVGGQAFVMHPDSLQLCLSLHFLLVQNLKVSLMADPTAFSCWSWAPAVF